MALTDILQKILEEADDKVADIKAITEKEEKELKANYKKMTEDKISEIESNKTKKKEDVDRKMSTLAKMEKRNQLLSAKQENVNKKFEEALAGICNFEDSKIENLLVALIKKLPKVDGGEITPAKGKKAITEKALKEAGSEYSVGEEGLFKGGFILKSEKMEVDYTFEGIVLKNLKSKIIPQVAEKLFSS